MRYTQIHITSLFISVLFSNTLFGQLNNTSISEIDNYIRYTDSLIHNFPDQFYRRAITENATSTKKSKTLVPGYNKRFNQIKGDWQLFTFQKSEDSIYTISYYDDFSTDFYFYLTFYYKDNLLLYSKLEYREPNSSSVYYKKEEYYKNENVLFTNESVDKLSKEYRQRININLYKQGNKYLQEFLEIKNSG